MFEKNNPTNNGLAYFLENNFFHFIPLLHTIGMYII